MTVSSIAALVTGAGSPAGIGFAIAAALGRQGCRIVVASTTSRIEERVRELRDAGVDASGFVADLTDARAAETLVERAGDVGVLVNNAGLASLGTLDKAGPLETISDDTWHLTLNRNLTTAFNVTRAVLPGMKARKWGRIVNISSTTGTVAGIANDSVYGAAKAGMLGLTRGLSLEVARYGITVNAVAPGWIATGSQTPAEAEAGRSTPVGRSGTPAEIASCVAWLASAGASYITGQLVVVDGGNSIIEDKGKHG
ncbi:MAG: SDR family NAD(P)-dependent oxidoreductase [Parvibaculaceae bacterium]